MTTSQIVTKDFTEQAQNNLMQKAAQVMVKVCMNTLVACFEEKEEEKRRKKQDQKLQLKKL
jgi:hypothetical protein